MTGCSRRAGANFVEKKPIALFSRKSFYKNAKEGECQHSLQIVATIYFAMILWLLSTAVDASKSTFSIQFKCLFLHLIYLNAFLFCLLLLMLHSLGPFTHDTLTAMPLSSCSRQKLCGRLDLHVFERHTLTT
mmetsp:Transcript_15260/g.26158  ORF Transcript_15260/g.26158 Transcript_15260/m.26158 type:complete len:132 (+) Transcript_15260:162-557(+)